MDKELIEYMAKNPSKNQLVLLKDFYSGTLKIYESIKQYKIEEQNKLLQAYNEGDKDTVEKIMDVSYLFKEQLQSLEDYLGSLENIIGKGDILIVDLLSGNQCIKCENPINSLSKNPMHIKIYQDEKHRMVLNRERIETIYCTKCKNRYVSFDEYTRIKSFCEISKTNLLVKGISLVPTINTSTVIILSNTIKCSVNHITEDVVVKFPIIDDCGNIIMLDIAASYCYNCQRFTILKDTFKRIEGIIACRTIDETAQNEIGSNDEMEFKQKESILYQYGYNVKSNINLPDKQRQTILALIIESNILNRRDICNHINMLVKRGEQIPKWINATRKWKEDIIFIENYNTGYIPTFIADKIIIK